MRMDNHVHLFTIENSETSMELVLFKFLHSPESASSVSIGHHTSPSQRELREVELNIYDVIKQ